MKNEIASFMEYLKDTNQDLNKLTSKEIKEYWKTFEATISGADEVKDWIEDWVDIFPRGVKNKAGKLLRHPAKSVLKKMEGFMKEYDYDVQTIIEATKAYIKNGEDNDFRYTRAAIYFISKKGEGSDLASWCERVKSGQTLLDELEEDEEYYEDGFI